MQKVRVCDEAVEQFGALCKRKHMALSDVTIDSVLRAVEEYRALGQNAFLEKYGFGKSTRYLLRIDGEDFDSKAIVGAAPGFGGPYVAALAAADRSAKVGSAIGLSLAAISHAKLDDMNAAKKDLAEMAEAWPLLARDPAAAYGNFQVEGQIIAVLVEGLRAAGLNLPDAESQ